MPDRWPAVGEFLQRETGHSFPVLANSSFYARIPTNAAASGHG